MSMCMGIQWPSSTTICPQVVMCTATCNTWCVLNCNLNPTTMMEEARFIFYYVAMRIINNADHTHHWFSLSYCTLVLHCFHVSSPKVALAEPGAALPRFCVLSSARGLIQNFHFYGPAFQPPRGPIAILMPHWPSPPHKLAHNCHLGPVEVIPHQLRPHPCLTVSHKVRQAGKMQNPSLMVGIALHRV